MDSTQNVTEICLTNLQGGLCGQKLETNKQLYRNIGIQFFFCADIEDTEVNISRPAALVVTKLHLK
jgi:hypothetical protein